MIIREEDLLNYMSCPIKFLSSHNGHEVKRKTFKDNESYFEFYNKMKDVINITSVKVLEDKIKIEYEDREVL